MTTIPGRPVPEFLLQFVLFVWKSQTVVAGEDANSAGLNLHGGGSKAELPDEFKRAV
jgi:hypothetical protein